MVAYNFQQQFVAPIEAGTKTQTMRAIGKRRHARVSETLQLYTGMRRKGETRMILHTVCTISFIARLYLPTFHDDGSIMLGSGQAVTRRADLNRFARKDGFADWNELCNWVRKTHGDPATWDCHVIGWVPPRAP